MARSAPPHHIRLTGGQQGQIVDTTAPVVRPDLGLPLINEPAQANPPAQIMARRGAAATPAAAAADTLSKG